GEPQELSFAQQRLWFLDQLEGATPTYNVPLALQVEGPIDVPALERALSDMVERHRILGARFVDRNGQPAQVLDPEFAFTIPIVDITDAELVDRIQAYARRPFDLAAGRLLRAVVFRRTSQSHVLLVNMHHIVSD